VGPRPAGGWGPERHQPSKQSAQGSAKAGRWRWRGGGDNLSTCASGLASAVGWAAVQVDENGEKREGEAFPTPRAGNGSFTLVFQPKDAFDISQSGRKGVTNCL
jgi:hypothetical protein